MGSKVGVTILFIGTNVIEGGISFFYLWPLTDMISQEPDGPRQQDLYRQETQIEMGFLGQKKISKADLMSSTRNLAALASLHRSVVCSLFTILDR